MLGTKEDLTADERCQHAGKPVLEGTKYALVTWVTQRTDAEAESEFESDSD